LKWSTNKPDRNGWYWKYGPGYGGITIEHVEIRHNEIWADGVKVDDGWMWAGPIPLPEGELPPPEKKA
jgi:hypothetical protein